MNCQDLGEAAGAVWGASQRCSGTGKRLSYLECQEREELGAGEDQRRLLPGCIAGDPTREATLNPLIPVADTSPVNKALCSETHIHAGGGGVMCGEGEEQRVKRDQNER